VINTNLIGTINTIQVALPHLREGASIIATGGVDRRASDISDG
jgi:NAD(P)-dependent dehydrogenase (short-subunit alcohol dehydrogenase family)